MKVEVVTPEENMGDIIGDLNKRRGQIAGMESRGNARVVGCQGAVVGDVRLRYGAAYDLVGTRYFFDGVLSHFEEVPANLAKEIIEKQMVKRNNP